MGNHGLEGTTKTSLKELRQQSLKWKKVLEKVLKNSKDIVIEDKRYSLSLHYRNAKVPAHAKKLIEQAVLSLEGEPKITLGKYVFNIIPKLGPDKGEALQKLKKRVNASACFFIGDDCTDEDVFRLQDKDLLTVRVYKNHNSRAKFYIKKRNEINFILRKIIQVKTQRGS